MVLSFSHTLSCRLFVPHRVPDQQAWPEEPDINMMTATSSLLALLVMFSRTASASSCVELQGIIKGGGTGLLDLSVLELPESLGTPLAPLDIFTNPTVPTVREKRWMGVVVIYGCAVHIFLSRWSCMRFQALFSALCGVIAIDCRREIFVVCVVVAQA